MFQIFSYYFQNWPIRTILFCHGYNDKPPLGHALESILNGEIMLPLQLDCHTPRKFFYKPSKSTNIYTNTSICIHGGSWVPTTPTTNSKIVHSCIVTINVYTMWNVQKLVRVMWYYDSFLKVKCAHWWFLTICTIKFKKFITNIFQSIIM